MDEQDGGLAAPLQLAQAVEDGGDLGDGVLVDAMQANKGVEDKRARLSSASTRATCVPARRTGRDG